MKIKIRSKLSDYDIKKAVFDVMNNFDYHIDKDMLPTITKKLLPSFIKLPEIEFAILEYALYAMENDEDLVMDLLLLEIEREVEKNYSVSINRHIASWINSLRNQNNEEAYELTKGRTL